jgi:hypothetical protein
MRMFLRKSRIERDPLAVTMTGVRLGEKALQIGEGDTRVVALIAARTGLTGTAAIVVLDDQAAARVRRAVTDIGALAEVGVVDREDPPADAAYDVIVVHDVEHTIAAPNDAVRSGWLQLCHRVLRGGGRIVTIEPGSPVGLRAWFGGHKGAVPAGGIGSKAALESAGFRNVRLLADRDGLRFIEGFKKAD